MNISKKILYGTIPVFLVLLGGGCQIPMEQLVFEERLEQIDGRLGKIIRHLEKPEPEVAAQPQPEKIVKAEAKPEVLKIKAAEPAPVVKPQPKPAPAPAPAAKAEIQPVKPAAPAPAEVKENREKANASLAGQRLQALAKKILELKRAARIARRSAQPARPLSTAVKPAKETAVAKPEAKPAVPVKKVVPPPRRTARQGTGAMLAAYFDARNFRDIPQIKFVSELSMENNVIKIAYKAPYHSQLFLGNFEGEEFLVRVSFAHMKNNRCFMEISAPPFNKVYVVHPWDQERIVDTRIKSKEDKTGIYVTMSGTQYLKSIIVYKLK